jgi:multisubunit Na+/H+ antiporter MnhE subunit
LFTTLVAIGVLVNLILNVKSIHFDTTKDFLIYLTPRLSLAIFIEVFSFFFLKLYKTNLEDVKYFHNERTNIDSKIIALKTSLLVEKDDILIEIIKSFSNVERNFILKKEETTVNIERIKMDNEQEINLISKLSDIIEKIKK